MSRRILDPRITFFDIETSENQGRFWRPGYKVNLSADNIDVERVILTASWSHSDEPDHIYRTENLRFTETDEGQYRFLPDDKWVVEDIVEGLKDTDVLVHHNGDKFDLPWLNGRAAFHRLSGVGPIRTVDTLKIARRLWNLNSYRLDYIGGYLGVGHKIKTEYGLWKQVIHGDAKAYQRMCDYCDGDVELLEQVYNVIDRYNTAQLKSNEVESFEAPCPFCGGTKKQKRGYRLNLKTYRRTYQCVSDIDNGDKCGKWLVSTLRKK